MSDQLGYGEVATNGKHLANAPSDHGQEASPFATSTEDRLSQLTEAIEAWDWRTALEGSDGPPTNEVAVPTVAALTPTAPLESRPHAVEIRPDPPEHRPDPVDASAEPVEVRAQPPEVRPDPVEVPAGPAGVRDDPTVPVMVMGSEGEEHDHLGAPAPSGPGSATDSPPGADSGLVHRVWSHRWTKATLVCVVAVAAVLLIIGVIRLAHSSPNSSGSSTTSTQRTTSHHSATTPTTSFVSPITSAQMAYYESFAHSLARANVAASKAVVGAGANPTTAELASAMTAYHTAVDVYDFQLRFIQWPASMQGPIADDHSQLETLASFLATFSTVSPTNMRGWLSGFHIRTSSAQVTDNMVRSDLGLPSVNTFP